MSPRHATSAVWGASLVVVLFVAVIARATPTATLTPAPHPAIAEALDALKQASRSLRTDPDYPALRATAEQALTALREHASPDDPRQAKAHELIGTTWYYQGDHNLALHSFGQAESLLQRRFGPEHPQTLLMQLNRASVLLAENEPSAAHELLTDIQDGLRPHLSEKSPEWRKVLNNLAVAATRLGRFDEAEANLKRALYHGLVEGDTSWRIIAVGLQNLADIARLQGRIDEALSYLEEALLLRGEHQEPNHPDVLTAYLAKGEIELHRGDTEAAAETVELVRKGWMAAGGDVDDPLSLELRWLFGRVLISQGKPAAAAAKLRPVVQAWEERFGRAHPLVWNAKIELATAAYLVGDLDAADDFMMTGSPSAPPRIMIRSVLLISFVRTAEDEHRNALAAHYMGLKIFGGVFLGLNQVLSEQNQVIFFRTFQPLVARIVALFLEVQRSEPDHAGDVVALWGEFSTWKGLTLRLLVEQQQRSLADSDPETQVLFESLVQARQRYARLAAINMLDDTAERATDPDLLSDIHALQTQWYQATGREVPRLEFELDIDELRGKLHPGECLVDVWRYPLELDPVATIRLQHHPDADAEYGYAAFVLEDGKPVRLVDLGPAKGIENAVRLLRMEMRQAQLGEVDIAESMAELDQMTSFLHERLITPLGLSEDVRRLTIVPDGPLFLLPFELLRDEQGRLLDEKVEVGYLSSVHKRLRETDSSPSERLEVAMFANPAFGEARAEVRAQTPKPTDLVSRLTQLMGFGKDGAELESSPPHAGCLGGGFALEPLQHAHDEAEQVRKVLAERGARVSLYEEQTATEERFYQQTSPDVLHLSTHGFFLHDCIESGFANPLLFSGVALAGINEQQAGHSTVRHDGLLSAYEIAMMDLRGLRLVTMSACETGLGEIQSGDGVYGLRRAFEHAGAESIVMSLWKIPDRETASLMVHFYSGLAEGQDKVTALSRARAQVRKEARKRHGVAHPLFWAGMILEGDASPLWPESQKSDSPKKKQQP